MNRERHKKSSQHLIVQILGKTIADRMMQCQKEQGNIPNLDIFLKSPTASYWGGGFIWAHTKEGQEYWNTLLVDKLSNHYLYQKMKK